jgi:hypothetical protein
LWQIAKWMAHEHLVSFGIVRQRNLKSFTPAGWPIRSDHEQMDVPILACRTCRITNAQGGICGLRVPKLEERIGNQSPITVGMGCYK